MADDAAVEQMQTKIAFLESAMTDLSDVMYRQDQEIRGLRLQLAALLERMGAARFDEPAQTAEQERPPHY